MTPESVRDLLPPRFERWLSHFLPDYEGVLGLWTRVFGEHCYESEPGGRFMIDYTRPIERRMREEQYERGRINSVLDRVSSDSFFTDVGSNVGFYAINCGLLSENGRVDAFEPHPQIRQRLLQNASVNQLTCEFHTLPYAVSDTDGSATLTVDQDRLGQSTLTETTVRGETGIDVSVPLVRLDSVYAEGDVPDVVKVDVEGAEIRVLRGASSILAAATPELFIEVHKKHLLDQFGDSMTDLLDILIDAGYTHVRPVGEEWFQIEAFQDYRDTGVPKYQESVFLHAVSGRPPSE